MATSHAAPRYPGSDQAPGSAEYQLASDGYDGVARSGVIRKDGKWVPAEAGNPDWYAYCQWLHESEDNNPAPFASPRDGGIAIKLEPNQSAIGSMLDSVDDPDMPVDAERPRRLPHQADVYNPPRVSTDHSHSPAREQRGDAFKPLTDAERQARDQRAAAAPGVAQGEPEGIWTQSQADYARRVHEGTASVEGRATGPSLPRGEPPRSLQELEEMGRQRAEEAKQQNEDLRQFEADEALRRQPTLQSAEENPSPAPQGPSQGPSQPPANRPAPHQPPSSGSRPPLPNQPQPPQHTTRNEHTRDRDDDKKDDKKK